MCLKCFCGKSCIFLSLQSLVLRVWEKKDNSLKQPNPSTDSAIGFISIDLSPLILGLHQIYGWYNVMDFSGKCQGQVKVSTYSDEVSADTHCYIEVQ